MTELSAMACGAEIGLSIAAPIGPTAVLCISRSMNAGIMAGISTGAAASTVHATYASVVLFGLTRVGPMLATYHVAMNAGSAGRMLLFAWRILHQRIDANEGPARDSVIWNYGSAVGFCCFNPMLFVLLIGSVGVVIGPEPPGGSAIWLMLFGVFIGSVGWWVALSAVTSALRGRLSPGFMRGFHHVAAAGMLVFAAISLAHVFRS
jgi:threonine/homoserine/homoserine lactone efflux protein